MFLRNKKFLVTILIVGIFLIVFFVWSYLGDEKALEKEINWGVTYSAPYAEFLGLAPRETYLQVLDELKVRDFRLPVYWNLVEKERGKFDWDDLDWQVAEAEKRGAEILLVIGRRVPRWPECFDPSWLGGLSKEDRDLAALNLIKNAVEHFKNQKAIKYWQVENEPFLNSFGECPPADMDLLQKEIDLARSLDSRPIVITESGELSSWNKGSRLADILGVSMYRVVWNKDTGYFRWFLPPSYYRLKALIVGRNTNSVFNTELQAEPWAPTGAVMDTSLEEQYKSMSMSQFQKNINFARRTGFSTVYLWGVEWWYFMSEKLGVRDFLNEAAKLWR